MMSVKEHPPGYWLFVEEEMLFNCPCGCGYEGRLRTYLSGTIKPAGTSWMWDGDPVRPSLHPSIKRHTPCGFHGFLTDGKWNNPQADGALLAPNVYEAPR